MINIQPIEIPLFGTITQVEIIIPTFSLSDLNTVSIEIHLYINGQFFKKLDQPIPQNVYNSWGTDDNYLINWALEQNGFTIL